MSSGAPQNNTEPPPLPETAKVAVKPFPGFWAACLMLVVLMFSATVVIAVVILTTQGMPKTPTADIEPPASPVPIAIATLGPMILVSCGALMLSRRPVRQVLKVSWPGMFPLLFLVPAMFGFNVMLGALADIVHLVWPVTDDFMEYAEHIINEDYIWESMLILIVFFPLCEEFLFRGIFMHGFLHRYRPGVAILLSAILFSVFHLNVWQGVSTFFLGLVLGWLRWRSDALVLPVAGHVMNNAVGFVISYGFNLEIPAYTTLGEPGEFQPLWFTLGGVVVAASGFLGLVLHFRERERAEAPAKAG